MAADPVTQDWWAHTDPCQTILPRPHGREMDMEEVFFAP